ncbi:MAG: ribosome assembly cofactor RimP [Spirochaetales bacterium]|nr:ribosome assembly cofactor RimP [Spirochaetales bacterium]
MFEVDFHKDILTDLIYKDIKPIISGLGFDIVELKIGRTRKEIHITVVIYKSNGIGINDCTLVSKTIQPRIELFDEIDRFILKVTSPGIDRIIKNKEEFRIFKNRGVKLLLLDSKEWCGGIIKESDETGFSLQIKEGIMHIDYTTIKKAKLDYTEEIGDK